MGLHHVATSLASTGQELTDAAAALRRLEPGAAAFGAEATGRLGELGRALHGEVVAALDARMREAAAHGARLHELADRVERAAARYADTDGEAGRRHRSAGAVQPRRPGVSDA